MERSAWVWNDVPPVPDYRRLRLAGCDLAIVKAVWEGPPARVADQYARAVGEAGGVPVAPFTYPLGGGQTAAEIAALVAAVRGAPLPPKIVLNPEDPWRGVDAGTVAPYVAAVRAALPGIPIWFSSVPSWADFPYEAWCAACDGSYPQCYPGYGDQLGAEAARNRTGKPVIPIAANWSGASPLQDGARLAGDRRVPGAGLSYWQAGSLRQDAAIDPGFDYAAAAQVWGLTIMQDNAQEQCRQILWAWFKAKPGWEQGDLGKARWFTADFSSFGEANPAYGLVYEYGAAWCAPGGPPHAIQPDLWPRVFGPGGLATVEGGGDA